MPNNMEFSRGNNTNLNFAGTEFTPNPNLDAPQRQGMGVDRANSAWLARVYSKKLLRIFKRLSVVEAITNSDYYGELNAYGDSVNVLLEPKMKVIDYHRGKTLESQAIDSDGLTLTINIAKYFQFQVDDIEKRLSHMDWMEIAKEASFYDLRNDYDKRTLNWIVEQIPFDNILASPTGMDEIKASRSMTPMADLAAKGANVLVVKNNLQSNEIENGTHMQPLDVLSKLGEMLDKNEVPEDNRWAIVSPHFIELIMRNDSRLLNKGYLDMPYSITNGLVSQTGLRGFIVFKSNNLSPLVTTQDFDSDITIARPNTDGKLQDKGDVVMAGHKSAVAAIHTFGKTEAFRSKSTFADVFRGLQLRGRKVVRPEALVGAAITYGEIIH